VTGLAARNEAYCAKLCLGGEFEPLAAGSAVCVHAFSREEKRAGSVLNGLPKPFDITTRESDLKFRMLFDFIRELVGFSLHLDFSFGDFL